MKRWCAVVVLMLIPWSAWAEELVLYKVEELGKITPEGRTHLTQATREVLGGHKTWRLGPTLQANLGELAMVTGCDVEVQCFEMIAKDVKVPTLQIRHHVQKGSGLLEFILLRPGGAVERQKVLLEDGLTRQAYFAGMEAFAYPRSATLDVQAPKGVIVKLNSKEVLGRVGGLDPGPVRVQIVRGTNITYQPVILRANKVTPLKIEESLPPKKEAPKDPSKLVKKNPEVVPDPVKKVTPPGEIPQQPAWRQPTTASLLIGGGALVASGLALTIIASPAVTATEGLTPEAQRAQIDSSNMMSGAGTWVAGVGVGALVLGLVLWSLPDEVLEVQLTQQGGMEVRF